MVQEKSLESPLHSKEIKPVSPKGIFIVRANAEAEAPILWPPDANGQLIGKDPDAGKNWRRRRGWQRMRWLDYINDSMAISLSKLQEMIKDREAWHVAVHRVAKNWTRLSDWTTNKGIQRYTWWTLPFTDQAVKPEFLLETLYTANFLKLFSLPWSLLTAWCCPFSECF